MSVLRKGDCGSELLRGPLMSLCEFAGRASSGAALRADVVQSYGLYCASYVAVSGVGCADDGGWYSSFARTFCTETVGGVRYVGEGAAGTRLSGRGDGGCVEVEGVVDQVVSGAGGSEEVCDGIGRRGDGSSGAASRCAERDQCGQCGVVDLSVSGEVEPVCPQGRVAQVDGAGGQALGDEVIGGRGPNWSRNRAWKAKKKRSRAGVREVPGGAAVPVWRRGAKPVGPGSVPSLAASVRTVDTECAEEIEARRTLAARRIMENRVAEATAEYRLESLRDPAKTKAVRQLSVVRLHERINTVRAKSEASFKKCGSPLESVGSAASAGEYALKQETRRRLAQEHENKNLSFQLDELLKIATPKQLQVLSALKLLHVPTEAEIQAEDEDISPFYTMDEMEADAAKYFATHADETDDWLGR